MIRIIFIISNMSITYNRLFELYFDYVNRLWLSLKKDEQLLLNDNLSIMPIDYVLFDYTNSLWDIIKLLLNVSTTYLYTYLSYKIKTTLHRVYGNKNSIFLLRARFWRRQVVCAAVFTDYLFTYVLNSLSDVYLSRITFSASHLV